MEKDKAAVRNIVDDLRRLLSRDAKAVSASSDTLLYHIEAWKERDKVIIKIRKARRLLEGKNGW